MRGRDAQPDGPPFDFLERTFFPVLRSMGAAVSARLARHGFYPAGGGTFEAEVVPGPLGRLELLDAGPVRAFRAHAVVAGIPADIAKREVATLESLRWPTRLDARVLGLRECGQGNAVVIDVERDRHVEVFTSFGARGIRAEQVARRAANEALAYAAGDAPVGAHLADQLLIPLAMAGSGAFRTVEPTAHTQTNAAVVALFTGARFDLRQDGASWLVSLG